MGVIVGERVCELLRQQCQYINITSVNGVLYQLHQAITT